MAMPYCQRMKRKNNTPPILINKDAFHFPNWVIHSTLSTSRASKKKPSGHIIIGNTDIVHITSKK